jgi:hypothetical protein
VVCPCTRLDNCDRSHHASESSLRAERGQICKLGIWVGIRTIRDQYVFDPAQNIEQSQWEADTRSAQAMAIRCTVAGRRTGIRWSIGHRVLKPGAAPVRNENLGVGKSTLGFQFLALDRSCGTSDDFLADREALGFVTVQQCFLPRGTDQSMCTSANINSAGIALP